MACADDHRYHGQEPKKKRLETSGTECFAINCTSYRNSMTKAEGITFHKFPDKVKNMELFETWARNCRRDCDPTAGSRICSLHFEEQQINRTLQRARLKEGAFPTIFELPKHLQPKITQQRLSRTSLQALEAVEAQSEDPNSRLDHVYFTHQDDDDRLLLVEEENKALKKQLRNAKVRENRAKHTCKDLIQQLSESSLINEELEMKLSSYADIPCELLKKSSNYTEDQRNFALTLHLYSSKAYRYLRDIVKINLPEPRTLRRWLERIDAEPGLNLCMLDSLAQKLKENPSDYRNCCLLLDAMAIKQQIDYDTHKQKFTGYVDLGNGDELDCEAKEVLVFMLVGLKGHWKAPIAYFFTRSLPVEVQTELVTHCLSKLQELGFCVRVVTMDGHATNKAMCKKFGCNLSLDDIAHFKPSFQIEGADYQTYVMFDTCHMIKLVRNTLQALRHIWSLDGQISWQLISDLHETQQQLGLRLANKLGNAHIDFHSQKMKVALAVQALSASVAAALQTLRDLGMKQFSYSGPTIEFIKRIDRLFDTLNSRSTCAAGTKKPIYLNEWQEVKQFLNETKNFLITLRTVDGKPLHKSPRGTCVMGLCSAIVSLEGLLQDLHQSQDNFKYLLTYKLSQDHLELFFSAVRQCGGWSNNPTALHFKYIFRRLLARSGALAVSPSANVSALEEFNITSAATSTYLPPTNFRLDNDIVEPGQDLDLETPPAEFHGQLSPLVENVVVYIAGWVVKKVMEKLLCDVCREQLVTTTASTEHQAAFTLLNAKNCGGLIKPAASVIDILLCAERKLRQITNIQNINRSCSQLKLESAVLSQMGCNAFEMDDHARSTTVGINNHYYDLVRLLVKTYFNLRFHHIVRLHNMKLQGKKIRQKCTKLVLFKGQ